MFLKPFASFSAPLPSWCIEYYRWKATVQVSLGSIASLGTQRALPWLSAKLGSAAGQTFWPCWTSGPSFAEVCIFFCIEIYRSPSHHVPRVLSLWAWGRLEGCVGSHSSSAPRAPAKPAQSKLLHPVHHTPFSSCVTMAMEKLPSVTSVLVCHRYEGLKSIGKNKSPVLIWCSEDLLEVNPNSSVNLLPLSNSLHNIAGIREFYDFLKTLHKYRQHNFI